jgi:hypothetical protein
MTESSKKPDRAELPVPSYRLTVVLIAVLALALRLALLSHTYDRAADAYHRAYICYTWALHPHIINGELWTPALTYLGGVLNLLGADPFVALRGVSLLSGILLIFVLAKLYACIFSRTTALLALFLLALFPLAAGMSVSSLCEIPYLLFFFAGYLLLVKAAHAFREGSTGAWRLLAATILAFSLASATRVESWLFIPIWLLYFHKRCGRPAASAALCLGLSAFPVYWLCACAFVFDSPVLSFLGPGVNIIYWQSHVGLPSAVWLWLKTSYCLLGAILLGTVLAGFGAAFKHWLAGRRTAGEPASLCLLHFSVSSLSLFLALSVVDCFGLFFENRFLILNLVLLMPYAGVVFDWGKNWLETDGEAKSRLYHCRCLIVALLLASSMLVTYEFYKPDIHIRTDLFKPVEEAAGFLNSPSVNAVPLLITTLRWNFQGYRLALLCRKKFKQITMVDNYYGCVAVMQARLSKYPPRLLVSTDKDGDLEIPYLRRAAEFELDSDCLFKSESEGETLTIFKILPGTLKLVKPAQSTLSCWKADTSVSAESAATNYSDYQW